MLTCITAACALLNVGLNYLLVPLYGMQGAALATTATFIVLATLAFFVGGKVYHVEYELRKILILFLSFLVLTSAFLVVAPESLGLQALLGLICMLVYASILTVVVGLPRASQLSRLLVGKKILTDRNSNSRS